MVVVLVWMIVDVMWIWFGAGGGEGECVGSRVEDMHFFFVSLSPSFLFPEANRRGRRRLLRSSGAARYGFPLRVLPS